LSEYVCLDTSVFARLTKPKRDTRAYLELIGDRLIALSFQILPELLSANFGPVRQRRVDALYSESVELPHTFSTSVQYAVVSVRRKELKQRRELGSDASDGDVWVIASSLEHRLPLLSHDRQQVALARGAGVETFTNLTELRDANPAQA